MFNPLSDGIFKYGANADVDTAAAEDIWDGGFSK
jgi:hypothetical protein